MNWNRINRNTGICPWILQYLTFSHSSTATTPINKNSEHLLCLCFFPPTIFISSVPFISYTCLMNLDSICTRELVRKKMATSILIPWNNTFIGKYSFSSWQLIVIRSFYIFSWNNNNNKPFTAIKGYSWSCSFSSRSELVVTLHGRTFQNSLSSDVSSFSNSSAYFNLNPFLREAAGLTTVVAKLKLDTESSLTTNSTNHQTFLLWKQVHVLI